MRRAVTVLLALVFAVPAASAPSPKASPKAIAKYAQVLQAQVDRSKVPRNYWLAECSSWPLNKQALTADGFTVRWIRARPGQRQVYATNPNGRRVMLSAHRIGSMNGGYSMWIVRGPPGMKVIMIDSGDCQAVASYPVMRATWAPADRTWIRVRSTCYGSATWRGRSYSVWPCRWAQDRAGSVTSLDGLGPGVLSGGSGAIAAGIEP